MTAAKIAFLGLGNMGSGMCSRVVAAGHPVTVWNRTRDKATPLLSQGAIWANTPAEAVHNADIVMTSLMDDASVKNMFETSGPVLTAMKPGTIHVSLSTISPECADEMAARHELARSIYVAAPVLGRPDLAQSGKLTQFLAGPQDAVERIKPFCQAFAQRIVVLPGPPSIANKQKLCMNFFIISLIESMAESFTFAEKIGASREILSAFFDQSFANPGFKQYANRLFEHNTDGQGGFAMTGGYKDVSLILAEAKRANCPLEVADVIASKMQAAIAQGMAKTDWSAIGEISRQRAGLK